MWGSDRSRCRRWLGDLHALGTIPHRWQGPSPIASSPVPRCAVMTQGVTRRGPLCPQPTLANPRPTSAQLYRGAMPSARSPAARHCAVNPRRATPAAHRFHATLLPLGQQPISLSIPHTLPPLLASHSLSRSTVQRTARPPRDAAGYGRQPHSYPSH